MRFSGVISAKLDAKGRVFFPSSFRKLLGDADVELVLKRNAYQPCLTVYPSRVWDAEVDALSRHLNRWNPREAMVFRRFMAETETFCLDAAGRFILPRYLAQAVGIDRELVFVGVDDRVELWGKERAAEPFIADTDYADALAELLGGEHPGTE